MICIFCFHVCFNHVGDNVFSRNVDEARLTLQSLRDGLGDLSRGPCNGNRGTVRGGQGERRMKEEKGDELSSSVRKENEGRDNV